MNQNVGRALEHHAGSNGESVFCVFQRHGRSERITFAQLYARSRAYAAHFLEAGVVPGQVVLVMLEHSPHLYYAFLGAMLAGAVPSFMPFPSPKQRPDLFWDDHQRLFARIEPARLVTYRSNAEEAQRRLGRALPPVTIADDAILIEAPRAPLPGLEAARDSIACLQHSSGTTGTKKGVMLSHDAILRQIESYGRAIALNDTDTIASWLPLYHDMGFIACFMTSIVRGVRLIALDPFEWAMRPRILLDAIEAHAATLCWLPNFAFSHLAQTAGSEKRWDLSSIRAFINCSEPCKPRAFTRFLERFSSSGIDASRLQVCYALAENVFAATQTTLGLPPREADGMISCGRAIEGVEIEIRNGTDEALPEAQVGEIALRGSFLFSGYYRAPELSAARIRDGWYSTGDLGILRDGELYVAGRVDDLIAIGGRNYYAHEIEEIVSLVPACVPGRAVALTIDDEATGMDYFAVLAECTEGADADSVASEIRTILLERIGIVPRAVFPLERGRLIKTTSGKLSRSANKQIVVKELLAQ